MPLVYYPAVSGYVIRYTSSKSGNKTQILLTSASKEGRVTGQVIDLTYDEVYTFSVAAQLSHGTGPFSDPVTVTTSHNPYLYSFRIATIFLGITTGVLLLICMALCHCACKW